MSEPVVSKRVLVTGSSGTVGRAAARELLKHGHFVRGFDCVDPPDEPALSEGRVGDLTDRAAVDAAAEGMDTVIHLAAYPDDADFLSALLRPNIVGLYHVCEAARVRRVRRLILASTVQVVWPLVTGERQIELADGVVPINHYALAKVYAEHMGAMYAREYGLSVLAVRLGWVPRATQDVKVLDQDKVARDIYLSHRDAGRAFALAVNASRPSPGTFAVIFLSSQHDGDVGMDRGPARDLIGFEAGDKWPEGMEGKFQ